MKKSKSYMKGTKEAKKPKQMRIPGTEDARIDALEDKAEEYADIRDQRIALIAPEVELKKELLALMKANKKEHYKRDGIEVNVVHEKENVRVRIKKDGQGGE
jgi:hypothetical protein